MRGEGAVNAAEENERPSRVIRLLRRLRPRDGYAVLVLAWGAVISLPAAAIEGDLLAGLMPTTWLATLALLFTWWLAGRRLRGWQAAPVVLLAGALSVLGWGVHVFRPGLLLAQAARWIAWWLSPAAPPAPPLAAFEQQAAALANYGQRIGWWTAGLASGRGVPDNLVVLGLADLLCWAVAAWAAWWLVRRELPFVALLPTGILLATQVYWASTAYWTLLAYAGAMAALLALLRMERQMQAWERDGVDYSPEVRLDITLTAMGVTALVVILMPVVPFLTSRELSQAFWRIFERPYRQVEQQLGQSFQGLQPARSLVPASGVTPGGLPRAHLLGGRPELGEEVALRVQVRGTIAGPPPYWRGQTFAAYSGRGWQEEPAIWQDFAAGEAWAPAPTPASREALLVSVRVLAGSHTVLYAPGEPVSVDRPYRALSRGPGELIALQDRAGSNRYAVLSAVPRPAADLLRAAGELYPEPIRAVYLQLPAVLPAELVAYAVQLTAAAPTPFERGLAIEAALRGLPYSLDVPRPPADRELVSWFLFDLRRGYCDYFATAMVVLARLNGIPARLAVGYATGDLDATAGEYVVTEQAAHAWPELYFPGYGWIAFEPTPAQAAPVRAAAARPTPPAFGGPTAPAWSAGIADLRALAAEEAVSRERRARLRAALASLNALALLAAVLLWHAARQPRPPSDIACPPNVAAGYERLLRWGARLGRPAQPADTPRAYADALAEAAEHLASRARRNPARAARAAALVRAQAHAAAAAYECALYGPEAAPAAARASWRPVRSALRGLWLTRLTSAARDK